MFKKEVSPIEWNLLLFAKHIIARVKLIIPYVGNLAEDILKTKGVSAQKSRNAEILQEILEIHKGYFVAPKRCGFIGEKIEGGNCQECTGLAYLYSRNEYYPYAGFNVAFCYVPPSSGGHHFLVAIGEKNT